MSAAWDRRLRPPPIGTGNAKCFSSQTFTSIGLLNTGQQLPSQQSPLLIPSALNAATDFLLALLPVPLVWRLHLNLRAKLSLILVLTLGVFAGLAGIVKSEKQKLALYTPDQYVHDTFTIWWFVEYNIGMIAASLPALKPLFRRVLETAKGTTATRSSRRRWPSDLGYQKQDERSDKGIMMEFIAQPGNEVEVSSAQPDKDGEKSWRIGHARNGGDRRESQHAKNTANAIYVTRDVQIS